MSSAIRWFGREIEGHLQSSVGTDALRRTAGTNRLRLGGVALPAAVAAALRESSGAKDAPGVPFGIKTYPVLQDNLGWLELPTRFGASPPGAAMNSFMPMMGLKAGMTAIRLRTDNQADEAGSLKSHRHAEAALDLSSKKAALGRVSTMLGLRRGDVAPSAPGVMLQRREVPDGVDAVFKAGGDGPGHTAGLPGATKMTQSGVSAILVRLQERVASPRSAIEITEAAAVASIANGRYARQGEELGVPMSTLAKAARAGVVGVRRGTSVIPWATRAAANIDTIAHASSLTDVVPRLQEGVPVPSKMARDTARGTEKTGDVHRVHNQYLMRDTTDRGSQTDRRAQKVDALSPQGGATIALRGDVMMDGRKLGRLVAAGQTNAARLPQVSASSVNLRALPIFPGTRVPL